MAENKGWIKLYRNLLMNELWIGEPFTKGQAWVDILLRVNHKNNKVLIGNQCIGVSKGQTVWSIKDMANRWKWSRKKVTNFLKMLKREHQIDYKSTTKYTIVTVVNWEVYQNEIQEETSNIVKKNIKGTSKEHQKNTNKNDKNDKNVKNIYSHFENDKTEEKYLEIFNHWNKEHEEKGIAKAIKLNTDIKKGVDNALKLKKEDDTKITIEDIKESISNYAEVYNLELFTYQWRLVEFLKRKQKDTGIPQLLLFLNNGTTYVNCKAGFNKTNKQQANKSNVNSSQNNNNGWNGYKKFK